MYKINDLMYVFYWRNSKEDDWSISQPVTLGELIDDVEFDFGEDNGSLPLHDISWGHDEVLIYPVPPRKYAPVTDLAKNSPDTKQEAVKSAQRSNAGSTR